MAGNNSIQFLRGTRNQIAQNTQQLQDGQPLYNTTDNYLSIGGGGSNDLSKLPIACRELKGYVTDLSDEINSVTNTTKQWSIKYEAGKGIVLENNIKVKDPLVIQHTSEEPTNLQGMTITGARIDGFQSMAFGGKSYRKPTSNDRYETTAEGPQSFAYGGSCHAFGGFSFSGGKDNKSYQSGSVTFGGGNTVGLTEDEFNDTYTNKVDEQGYNYLNSYNWSFACGNSNIVKGKNSFTSGISNTIDKKSDICFVTGQYNTISEGIIGSSLLGIGLKSSVNLKTVIGTYNYDSSANIFEIGGGSNDASRSNLFQVSNSGLVYAKGLHLGNSSTVDLSLACGDQNYIAQPSSLAIGYNNSSTHWCSHLIGQGLRSIGQNGSTVVGSYNSTSIGGAFSVGTGWDEQHRYTRFRVCHESVDSFVAPTQDTSVLRKIDLTSSTSTTSGYDAKFSNLSGYSVKNLGIPKIEPGSTDCIRGNELYSLSCYSASTSSEGLTDGCKVVNSVQQLNGRVYYHTGTIPNKTITAGTNEYISEVKIEKGVLSASTNTLPTSNTDSSTTSCTSCSLKIGGKAVDFDITELRLTDNFTYGWY